MQPRTAFRLPWALWTLTLAALITPLIFHLTGHGLSSELSGERGDWAPFVAVLIFIPTFATAGALLASRRPENPIGWLLSTAALSYSLGTTSLLVAHFSVRWSDWISNWVWGCGLFAVLFVLLLFPTGTLPSRRWRPVAWFAWAAIVAATLGNMFAPGVITDTHSINPLGVGGPLGSVFHALQAALVLVLASGLGALASLVFRYRRADSVEREQLRWLVYAVGLILAAIVAGAVVQAAVHPPDLATNFNNAIVSLSFTFVPVAIGVAVLKYRLYDIDVVINKTVVFGALAAFITAVYVAIVVGIGAAIGQGTSKGNLGLSILATAVVAVAFQPVRERVQRFANRLVYGKRATPYEVLSEFAHRMAGSYAVDDLLPRMARILAEGTGAEEARVWLRVGSDLRPAAAWPDGVVSAQPLPLTDGEVPALPGTLSLPVNHRGELLGALSLTKPRGERLTPGEEKLATDLSSQAGLVLRNVRLTQELLLRLDELQASRQRIVAAQDQERRRLERNIHDGAQQQLVALAVKIRLAKALLGADPARFDDLMGQVETEAGSALEDLRNLARGIYPPLLADKGLVAARESQARRAGVPVTVEADGVGRYPQEAEAAVYFCVLEALQNVAKYAKATAAVIRLSEEPSSLAFQVTDDGAGFDPSVTSYGTGLQGMSDRLAALGGEVAVRSAPGAGTAVKGMLPVRELEPIG
jgi:signal transduction histidine kinase